MCTYVPVLLTIGIEVDPIITGTGCACQEKYCPRYSFFAPIIKEIFEIELV